MKRLISLLAAVLLLVTIPVWAQVAPDGAATELGDDLYAFKIDINGTVYAFPTDFAAFESDGWTYADDKADTFKPNQYTSSARFQKGENTLYVYLYNDKWDVVPASECAVAGVTVDAGNIKDASFTAALPGGIQYGVSKIEDVETAYGTPSDIYEGDLYTKYLYEYDFYQAITFEFDKETSILNSIAMQCMKQQEAPDAATVTKDPPQAVLDYVAPAELGEDPLSFNVEYAGNLYHLPAPVSAFLNNGWKLTEDPIIRAYESSRVELRYDNQKLSTYVYNNSEKAAFGSNCLVTEIVADVNTTNLPLTLPGGVKIGDAADAVKKAYSDLIRMESDSASFHYTDLGEPLHGVTIITNTETGLVSKIEVQVNPKKA